MAKKNSKGSDSKKGNKTYWIIAIVILILLAVFALGVILNKNNNIGLSPLGSLRYLGIGDSTTTIKNPCGPDEFWDIVNDECIPLCKGQIVYPTGFVYDISCIDGEVCSGSILPASRYYCSGSNVCCQVLNKNANCDSLPDTPENADYKNYKYDISCVSVNPINNCVGNGAFIIRSTIDANCYVSGTDNQIDPNKKCCLTKTKISI